jgi:hypothetical protein
VLNLFLTLSDCQDILSHGQDVSLSENLSFWRFLSGFTKLNGLRQEEAGVKAAPLDISFIIP